MALDGKGATELNGKHVYRLRYGNRGTAAAEGTSLSLSMPGALSGLRFTVQPTAVVDGTATWQLGTLPPSTSARTIEVTATITGTGSNVTPAAEITSDADANRSNNGAEVADDLVAIAMPVITGPANAVVGARPVFFGTGRPAATVALNLAGPDGGAAQLLGTDKVDGSGRWEIQPAADLAEAGWHWFTATQRSGDLVSETAGVADFDERGYRHRHEQPHRQRQARWRLRPGDPVARWDTTRLRGDDRGLRQARLADAADRLLRHQRRPGQPPDR